MGRLMAHTEQGLLARSLFREMRYSPGNMA